MVAHVGMNMHTKPEHGDVGGASGKFDMNMPAIGVGQPASAALQLI